MKTSMSKRQRLAELEVRLGVSCRMFAEDIPTLEGFSTKGAGD